MNICQIENINQKHVFQIHGHAQLLKFLHKLNSHFFGPDFPSVPCTFDDPTVCAVDVDCPHKPLSFQWKLVDRNSTGDWTPECKYLHFRMHKNNLVYEIGLIF